MVEVNELLGKQITASSLVIEIHSSLHFQPSKVESAAEMIRRMIGGNEDGCACATAGIIELVCSGNVTIIEGNGQTKYEAAKLLLNYHIFCRNMFMIWYFASRTDPRILVYWKFIPDPHPEDTIDDSPALISVRGKGTKQVYAILEEHLNASNAQFLLSKDASPQRKAIII